MDPEYRTTWHSTVRHTRRRQSEKTLFPKALAWWASALPPSPTPPSLSWYWLVPESSQGVKQEETRLCQLNTHCSFDSLEDGWQAEIWSHYPPPILRRHIGIHSLTHPSRGQNKISDKPKLASPSHSYICTHSPVLGQPPKHLLNAHVPWSWLLPLAELSPLWSL